MNRIATAIILAVSITAAQIALFLSPWGQSLELRGLDWWFHLRGPIAPPADVAIVLLDDSSREALGLLPNQPWPRSAHALLLHRLKQAGARNVVFDVLFLGPSADPAADEQLAAALGTMPTVLGAEYFQQDQGNFVAEGVNRPYDAFANRAGALGLVNFPEHDGWVRCFWMNRPTASQGLPTLSEAAVAGQSPPPVRPHVGDFLNYYGPPGTIPTYSYYQAVEPTTNRPATAPEPLEQFRNKIVFVRPATAGSEDAFLTPFYQYGRMPGVEIHATAAANLISHQWIRRGPRWLETTGLALLAAAFGLILIQLKPHWGFSALLGFSAAWVGLAYGGFREQIFVPGMLLVCIVLPATYTGSTLYYYLVTRREQRKLERAFQFYLSPEMARTVARDPAALRLGGEKVVATALFTDIENFTGIAEQMPPDQVAAMLNAYFTEVMNAIFEKQGTLIKFIGDAVFALWGSPIKTPDHARLACEAALAIQQEIQKFNASGRFPPLRSRIGIHTGPMIVGNMGSARRFDFTAIGDTVNLASRVEGLNKYFGTYLLITEPTAAQLHGALPLLTLGAFRVVGKQTAIRLHALLPEPFPATTGQQWTAALAEFESRHWETAGEQFTALTRDEPRLHKAATLYLDQIQRHQTTPPPADWHGEIIFTSK